MVFILVVQAGSFQGGMKLYYFTTSANTTADASPLREPLTPLPHHSHNLTPTSTIYFSPNLLYARIFYTRTLKILLCLSAVIFRGIRGVSIGFLAKEHGERVETKEPRSQQKILMPSTADPGTQKRGEALFPRNRNLEPAFGKVILRIQDEYL